VKDKSLCFFDPLGERKVKWGNAYGTGLWCLECITCWRTALKDDVCTLTNLQDFIKVDGDRWAYTLLSFISLVFEGKVRITKAEIEERCKSFKFVFSLTGAQPFHRQLIVPLSEMRADTTVLGKDLVTIRTNGVDSLGVSCHAKLFDSPSAFLRPRKEGDPPYIHHSSWLSSALSSDRGFMRQFFSMDLADLEGPSPSAPPPPVASTAIIPAPTSTVPAVFDSTENETKLERKVKGICRKAVNVFQLFVSENWPKLVKESAFTSLFNNMSTAKDETFNNGERAATDLANKWIAAISTGKRFVRAYVNYDRTNFKDDRLMEIAPLLTDIHWFLTSELGVTPAVPC